MQAICHKLQMFKKGLRSKKMVKMNSKTFFQIFSRLKKAEVDREQGKAFSIKTVKKGRLLLLTKQTKYRIDTITNTMKIKSVKTIILECSHLLNSITNLLKIININTKRIFHLSLKLLLALKTDS